MKALISGKEASRTHESQDNAETFDENKSVTIEEGTISEQERELEDVLWRPA